MSGWRKAAVAVWRAPTDPQTYGDIELDASAMLVFLEEARARTGVHVTVLHLVAKAIAHALEVHPELNVVPHGSRLVRRDRVDLSFIVTFAGGEHNVTVTIEDAARTPVVEIARELTARAERIRSGQREDLSRAAALIGWLPQWLLRPALRLAVWLTVDLGVDLSSFGLRAGLFGSATITTVGGELGIDHCARSSRRSRACRSRSSSAGCAIGRSSSMARCCSADGHDLGGAGPPVHGRVPTRQDRERGPREYCADPDAFEPPLADVIRGPVDRAGGPGR
jgi:hypothetical protein